MYCCQTAELWASDRVFLNRNHIGFGAPLILFCLSFMYHLRVCCSKLDL